MMNRVAVAFISFVCGSALGLEGARHLLAPSAGAGYSTEMLVRQDLQNLPGQEALVFSSTWSPGARLPWHMHPRGHEFTLVIEGEQTFHLADGVVKKVKAGEVIYTPPDEPHFGENATDKPSKTVVFRIKEKSQPIMVELK